MDLIGYVRSITQAAAKIDAGRKGFATRGKAEEGRIFYEDGIAEALSAFKEAQAIQSFDDAFRALKVVEDSTLYQVTEETIPHHKKYRVGGGFPKDSFHIACYPNKNIIRAKSINTLRKAT